MGNGAIMISSTLENPFGDSASKLERGLEVVTVERFESVSEVVSMSYGYFNSLGSESWQGGPKYQVKEALLKGDESLVVKSEKLFSQVKDIELPSTYGVTRDRDYFGGSLSFGDYQCGSPTPFRRSKRTMNDVSPLKVIIGITVSAEIDKADVINRGAAVLALVQKLQAVRPVELFLLCELGAGNKSLYEVIEVNTKPLDLATAVVALSHVGLSRNFVFGRAFEAPELRHIGWRTEWAYGFETNKVKYDKLRRRCLGLEPNDITIDSLHCSDKYLHDPLGWVNNQLEQVKARCLSQE